jgi:hypothetical protein
MFVLIKDLRHALPWPLRTLRAPAATLARRERGRVGEVGEPEEVKSEGSMPRNH